ncbi:MAG: hypothetical protein ACYSU7_16335 [Planctomycetota bacterium]|jgi:hypothetical protein
MLLSPRVWTTTTDRLRELGFRRRQADTFTADGVTVTARGGWLTLRVTDGAPQDAAHPDLLGHAGLWKPAPAGNGGASLTCDLPLAALLQRVDEDTDGVIDSILRWALETRPGAVMPGWEAPASDHIDALVPEAARSLRCGPYLEPVTVVLEEAKLALRVTIRRSGPLTGARRQWLDRVLADGTSFRMIRIGVREAGREDPVVEAETDLSGVPADVLDAALPVAFDALRACFSLLVFTTAVVCDPQCRSDALDHDPQVVLKPFDIRTSKSRSK